MSALADLAIPIKLLTHGKGLALPAYATMDAAGMDLRAAIEGPQAVAPGARALVPTGIAIALPAGFEAQVRPRSGLALRHGITVLNAPGTVDSDYRGEIKVILINHGSEAFTIARGERIAQLVIAPIVRASWHSTDALPGTVRGDGGHGSTGRA